ncbi:MAG: RNA polymerase subunit sigma [Methylobacterium sp.]|nr:MAG: RNA polymerase subunit sigma [Methylobacterium sp.]
MRLALDGDAHAYRTLLGAITPHLRNDVRRVLMRAGRGTADLEDIVQETLLAIHLKRATWDRTLPFTPWLNAVSRYKTIDALRRSGLRKEVELDGLEDALPAPEGHGDDALDSRRLLDALDARQREIVEQIMLMGRSASEVGRALGMSEGAVRVALHRALRKLAASFRAGPDGTGTHEN